MTWIRHLAPAIALLLAGLSPPASACRPFGSYQFVEDAGGGIWFTEGDNNALSRLAPNGTVTAHKLPTPNAEPSSVAADKRGNIWFVEMDAGKIGRLDKSGRIVEYPTSGGHPSQVAVDGQGEAWFTRMSGHENGDDHTGHGTHNTAGIGRIDKQGTQHFHPAPEGWPTSIAVDARGGVWVSLLVPGSRNGSPKGRLATLSRAGQWTVALAWDNSCPRNLTADRKGGLYFSDGCRKIAGHRAPDGKTAEWRLPDGTQIQSLSLARDGRLWFTDRRHLGYLDGKGKATLIDRPDNGDQTMAVLATRKGDVVFSEFYNYNINRLTRDGPLVEHLVNVDERREVREVKEGEICYAQFGARIAAKAEMDARRAAEVRDGSFKPDGAGTEKLVERKCLVCHDARRLLLSRRSDWTPSLTRMHDYRNLRNVEPLTADETARLVHYFNEHYGLR